jgi:hypothetical protein
MSRRARGAGRLRGNASTTTDRFRCRACYGRQAWPRVAPPAGIRLCTSHRTAILSASRLRGCPS